LIVSDIGGTFFYLLDQFIIIICYFVFYLLLFYYFLAHQHKAAGMKIRLSENNTHDGIHGIELFLFLLLFFSTLGSKDPKG